MVRRACEAPEPLEPRFAELPVPSAAAAPPGGGAGQEGGAVASSRKDAIGSAAGAAPARMAAESRGAARGSAAAAAPAEGEDAMQEVKDLLAGILQSMDVADVQATARKILSAPNPWNSFQNAFLGRGMDSTLLSQMYAPVKEARRRIKMRSRQRGASMRSSSLPAAALRSPPPRELGQRFIAPTIATFAAADI